MRKPVPAVLVGVFALGAYATPAYARGATDPAVTQATIGTTICTPGCTATVRPPSSFTDALKAQQIAALGLPGPASTTLTSLDRCDLQETH